MNIPDHPVIRNMEATGTPDGKEPVYPHCPICGKDCETVIVKDGAVVCCDECGDFKDAWEVQECFPESEVE